MHNILTRKFEDIQQMGDMTCQFCYQFFEEPVLLQCKHPICSKCAQTQFSFELLHNPCDNFPLKTKDKQERKNQGELKQKEAKEKILDNEKTVAICCPQCNEKTSIIIMQGVASLTRDSELKEKVKTAQEPKVFMCCEEDGNEATLYCENCEATFCKGCFEKQHSKIRKNHKATEIDANSPHIICAKHGHLLDKFCKNEQVPCCYKCFENGEHKEHEATFLSHVAEKIKKEASEKLTSINDQIKQIEQTLSNMGKLKAHVNKSHKQFTSQVKDNFNRIINLLEQKRDGLVIESDKMESCTLSNITLQQEALTDLLRQKTYTVEQITQWLNGNDLQVLQCKQLLQKNQEMATSMLICCESGRVSTNINVRPVEQLINTLASICKVPIDFSLPVVSGLKESTQGKNSVTIQWNPVKCDFPEIYFVVQTKEDNDDTTAKSFPLPSHVTSLQVSVSENCKQLECTVQCEFDDQFQGEKYAPLTIDLIGRPQDILFHLKEKCSQNIFERVQQVSSQKETILDLKDCNVGNSDAIAVARMFPHLTQLQELHLSNNRIDHLGAVAIANTISKLTGLQELHLSNNQIGHLGAIAIANAISKLTRLQRLYLAVNQIGYTGAITLSNAISNLIQLQELSLNTNQIGDSGAAEVACGVKNLTQLQFLWLGKNEIGDLGATAVAKSITNLTQLQQLRIENNQIGDFGVTTIANTVCKFTDLTFWLFNNNISSPLKQQLKQQFGGKIYIYDSNH